MDSDLYKPFEEKMAKSINSLNDNLSRIRAGRANPAVLERISVDYYGVPTPINQVANISIPEARVILIQPWDSNLVKDIEKSIQKSDIGINPNSDGKVLRLIFPPLTEERRKELTKVVKKEGEDSKIAIRSVRRDAIAHFKKEKKKSDITEDDLKDIEKDVQKLTDNYIIKIDNVVKDKEKEILEV
ncbi:MAG: ribosome recycling factor [Clostridiales bacterium]